MAQANPSNTSHTLLVLCGLTHLIGILIIVAFLVFVVPHFESMFADMGQELSAPTAALISVSEWFQNNFLLLICPSPFFVVADIVALLVLSRAHFSMKMIFIGSLIGFFLSLAAMIYALYMPIFAMASSVS